MTIVLGSAAVFAATFLGGVVGFAYGLVSFPLLLLAGVPLEQVVASNLLVALCTRIVILSRRHRDVNWRRAATLVVGSIPGMVVGMYVLNSIETRFIQLGAGVFIIISVIILVGRSRMTPPEVITEKKRRPLTLGAGVLGGFLGVTTSMNGVPPALMLTGTKVGARSIVADMAVYFIVGNLIALATLAVGGRLPLSDIGPLVMVWVPVGVAGTLAGLAAGPRLPQRLFYRLALTIIFLAGVSCITSS
jgi:uncharacterized membrane protein YfcA